MLLAVAVWTGASMSHAMMATFLGFALARAVLGLGEGATFPGRPAHGGRNAAANLRARGIALSFSGGTIGAVMMPLLLGPLAIRYGWRNAFLATGALGVDLDGDLGGHRPAAVPAGDAARKPPQADVAELRRAAGVGAHLQLRAAGHLAGARADDPLAVSGAGSGPDAGGGEQASSGFRRSPGASATSSGAGPPTTSRPTTRGRSACSCCSPRPR